MKQGIVTMILAVQISCPNPECGGICDNEDRGSSMIEEQDKVVVCERCGQRCKVPSSAWKVRQSKIDR